MASQITITTQSLRKLHRIHQQLQDLKTRLERGPRMAQAHRGHIASLQARVDNLRAQAKNLRAGVDDKQMQLQTRESGVKHRQQQLREAKSNKEYQALREQIAADEMTNSVLADEVLEGMERLDEVHKRVAEAEAALAGGQQEAAKSNEEFERKAPAIRADMERLEQDLHQAEEELPDDFRDAYRRLVRSKGSEGLAPVVDQSCGGCHQQITLNMLNALMLNQPVFCRGCGRLLYLPEEHGGD